MSAKPVSSSTKSEPKRRRRPGPYSREGVVTFLDRRTKEGRLMAKLEAALTAHVGGAPSAPQRVLIQRAAWLQLHLAQLDAQLINKGGIATGHDTNQYLA